MKNKIGLVILSGVLLVFGFVVFKYSNNNQQTDINQDEVATITEAVVIDTSDWETCRNEEYGYEFKYPKNWYIYEKLGVVIEESDPCNKLTLESNSIELSPVLATDTRRRDDPMPYFKLLFKKEPDFQNIYEYRNRPSEERYYTFPVIKEENVDGEVILWTKNGYEGSSFISSVEFFHNKILFNVLATNLEPDLTNKIISTFKFID